MRVINTEAAIAARTPFFMPRLLRFEPRSRLDHDESGAHGVERPRAARRAAGDDRKLRFLLRKATADLSIATSAT
jgi:hypothetical protein